MLAVFPRLREDGSPIKRSCVFWSNIDWGASAMAGIFEIDLDQPEENVSDDDLDDGVSLS